jgi:hypothetical protein
VRDFYTEEPSGRIRHRAEPCSSQHFSRLRLFGDARADVDGNASDLAVHKLALAGVQTRTDLDPELARSLGDRAGTADRASTSVWRSSGRAGRRFAARGPREGARRREGDAEADDRDVDGERERLHLPRLEQVVLVDRGEGSGGE